MRNILQYPITDDERKETLTQVCNDIMAQETIGDLRAVIVNDAVEAIDHKIEMDKKYCTLYNALCSIASTVTDDADRLREIANDAVEKVLK